MTKETVDKIQRQIKFAGIKHGEFDGSIDHRSMILVEEVGEFIQAANNMKEKGKGYIQMELELSQIAAVCFRFIDSIQEEVIAEKDGQMEIF